ncbi:MAG: transposase [Phycisphaerae bacterium]|nr:transposase [Phycisphaerae bacterium]
MSDKSRSSTPLRDLATYGRGRAVRLDNCDYGGDIDIHVTVRAHTGCPFAAEDIARMVCDNVEFYCQKLDYRLYGYCLMPDHLHVLLSPGDSGVSVAKWLDSFKSYTTNRFMKGGGQPPLWQRSAHDHVCRLGETVQRVMYYIADDPCRAGLVKRWDEWPWTKVFVEL